MLNLVQASRAELDSKAGSWRCQNVFGKNTNDLASSEAKLRETYGLDDRWFEMLEVRPRSLKKTVEQVNFRDPLCKDSCKG